MFVGICVKKLGRQICWRVGRLTGRRGIFIALRYCSRWGLSLPIPELADAHFPLPHRPFPSPHLWVSPLSVSSAGARHSSRPRQMLKLPPGHSLAPVDLARSHRPAASRQRGSRGLRAASWRRLQQQHIYALFFSPYQHMLTHTQTHTCTLSRTAVSSQAPQSRGTPGLKRSEETGAAGQPAGRVSLRQGKKIKKNTEM